MVKVAINGFGRIGRLVLRSWLVKSLEKTCSSAGNQIVAVNDPFMTTEQMAYFFKYDSTHGTYRGEVNQVGNCLIIDGNRIETSAEKDPRRIEWKKSCVDYVIEATGKYKTCDTASYHLDAGAKRVIITSPSKDAPMFVMGVNHDCYRPDMQIISMASCTTNCLAPLCKVVHDFFEIEEALMTTVHAVTPSQKVLDNVAGRKLRIGRGAFQNIIPTTTGAATALGRVIPELNGRITGLAFRVPVPDVSVVDLTVKLGKEASYETIKCKIKQASEGYMKGILGYTDEELVSSDLIGDQRSCIFDAKAGIALSKCFVKLIAWYDNEIGYATRVVDFMDYIASREEYCF